MTSVRKWRDMTRFSEIGIVSPISVSPEKVYK